MTCVISLKISTAGVIRPTRGFEGATALRPMSCASTMSRATRLRHLPTCRCTSPTTVPAGPLACMTLPGALGRSPISSSGALAARRRVIRSKCRGRARAARCTRAAPDPRYWSAAPVCWGRKGSSSVSRSGFPPMAGRWTPPLSSAFCLTSCRASSMRRSCATRVASSSLRRRAILRMTSISCAASSSDWDWLPLLRTAAFCHARAGLPQGPCAAPCRSRPRASRMSCSTFRIMAPREAWASGAA